MSDKLLQLCKRLNKFTLEEISLIAEINEASIEKTLNNLVIQNFLKKNHFGYAYINSAMQKNGRALSRIFQHHSVKTVELIINCFCAEISSVKTGLILEPNVKCICDFFKVFRELIYKKQEQKLLKHFKRCPQLARMRTFFDIPMYFYFYGNKVYVSPKRFDNENGKYVDKNRYVEFKKVYCYLKRVTSHHNNKTFLPHYLAEIIWRRNMRYEELVENLNGLINC